MIGWIIYRTKDAEGGAARQKEGVSVVREDIKGVGETDEHARDWGRWKQMIYCDDP